MSAEHQLAAQENSSNDPNSSIPETRSLLSISPSEPGMVHNLSSYPSSENTGSVGDLLDNDKLQRSRDVASPLSPTSSLPNLQPPIDLRRNDSSLFRRGLYRKDPALRPDSSPVGLRPLYESDSSFSTSPQPGSPNQNNSNNTTSSQLTQSPRTQRTGVKQRKVNKQSSFVGTSYLSEDVVTEKCASPLIASAMVRKSPRIKGRNERKGSSRYSYMHAVQDNSQI